MKCKEDVENMLINIFKNNCDNLESQEALSLDQHEGHRSVRTPIHMAFLGIIIIIIGLIASAIYFANENKKLNNKIDEMTTIMKKFKNNVQNYSNKNIDFQEKKLKSHNYGKWQKT